MLAKLLSLSALASMAILQVQAKPADLVTCLQQIKGSSYLITPSSNNYTIESVGENYLFNYKPNAIFHPGNEVDVQAAIKCAGQYNVAIAPRSGGHSFEGYCQGGRDGVLVLDLNQFKKFNINKKTNIATVGAGFRLGPLYDALWKSGKYMVSAGTCPTVGIGGHALGGGIGMTSRKYGLLSDNIVAMNIVTPDGKLNRVDKNSNKDLFWALRGAGGGSFGVVTQFEIQAYKAPSKVTTMTHDFPLSDYAKVLKAYAEWGQSVTNDLMAEMNLDSGGGIQIQVTYLGPKTDANKAVASLFAVTGKPKSSDVREGTWLDAAIRFAWMQNKDLSKPKAGDAHYAKGRSLVYRQPLSKEEGDIIYKYLSKPPKGITAAYVIVDLWTGKVQKPDSESSFVHRDAIFGIEFVTEWGGPETKPGLPPCTPCQKWSLAFFQEMLGAYSSKPIYAYSNYIDRDLPDSLVAYYGDSLPRLKSIKKAVDPKNLFNFPQSIPLS
ncbi:hypothetical protein BGW38_000694 [Lunasporangiospora selenospora]|uniref:FAD-binding PCMH-type domain-containing protein n=1 Tax=Lunasporangiospora selenospora TaxID=979761 RepID=A0A9P6KJ48_9FUNG|nr:hypothetical protein BGW38_000694 [Lunasporangiospora selenospora]